MLLTALVVLTSVTFAWLVLRLEFVSIVPLFIGMLLVAVVWRPLVGVCALFGLSIMFEGGSLDPLMVPGEYLYRGFQHSFGLTGLIASPLELLLVFTLFVWLIQRLAGNGLAFRGGVLGRPTLLDAGLSPWG